MVCAIENIEMPLIVEREDLGLEVSAVRFGRCNFEILIRYPSINVKQAVGNMSQKFRVEVEAGEKIELW